MPPDKHKSWHSRGYLPHFDQPGVVQFITFRLNDSLPAKLLKEWEATYKSEKNIELHRKVEAYLDKGYGCCHLSNPAIANIVEQALLHFDGQRYRLLAWVVMPNHVHTLIEEIDGFHLSDILHSWKSFTAKQAIKFLTNRASEEYGSSFWQRDYFDRYIRDTNHFGRVLEYTHSNPVNAKLCVQPQDYRFSSARLVKSI